LPLPLFATARVGDDGCAVGDERVDAGGGVGAVGGLGPEEILEKNWDDLTDADMTKIAGCGFQLTSCEKLHFDEHEAFGSAYFLELGLDRETLVRNIPKLFAASDCGQVLRVKGFVPGADGWTELNATADGINAAPLAQGQEVLIVIGEKLDKERIETVLRS